MDCSTVIVSEVTSPLKTFLTRKVALPRPALTTWASTRTGWSAIVLSIDAVPKHEQAHALGQRSGNNAAKMYFMLLSPLRSRPVPVHDTCHQCPSRLSKNVTQARGTRHSSSVPSPGDRKQE